MIVQQNTDIYDMEKEAFYPNEFFYIVLNGNFKVTAGQFNKNKRMDSE